MKEVYLFIHQDGKKRIYKQKVENNETHYDEIKGTAYNVLLEDCKDKTGEGLFYAFVKENNVFKQCAGLALKDRLLISLSEEKEISSNASILYFDKIEDKTKKYIAEIKSWIIQNHPGLLNAAEEKSLNDRIKKFVLNKDFDLSSSFNFKGNYKTSRNLFLSQFIKLFKEEISQVYRKSSDLSLPNPCVFISNNNILLELITTQAFADFQKNEAKTVGIIDFHSELVTFLKGYEFATLTEKEVKEKSRLDEFLDKAKEYENKNEIVKAKHFYDQALGLSAGVQKEDIKLKILSLTNKDLNNDKFNHIKNLKSKAQRAETLGEIQNAINFYNKAYDIALEINNNEEQAIIINLLKPLSKKYESAKGLQNNVSDRESLKKLIISAESYLLADNKTAALKIYIEAKQFAVKLKDNKSIKKIDKALKKINSEPINKVPILITVFLLSILGLGYYINQNGILDSFFSETTEINLPAYVVANSDLNVRNGNNDKYPVLTVISRGDSVFVLEESKETKWKKIRFNNKTGWASGKLISTVIPNGIKYINKNGIVQRQKYGTAELSTSSNQIKFSKNEQVKIIFENTKINKYRIVNNDNEYAFVSKKDIKILEENESKSWGKSVESRQNGNDLCIRCGNKEHMKYNCPICGGNGFYNAQ